MCRNTMRLVGARSGPWSSWLNSARPRLTLRSVTVVSTADRSCLSPCVVVENEFRAVVRINVNNILREVTNHCFG